MTYVIAWINASIGIGLGLWVGTHHLGWGWQEVLRAHLFSNVWGFLGLFFVTQIEFRPGLKTKYFRGSRRIWPFFLTVYYGGTLLFVPELRSLESFLWMAVPLALGNGLCILAFGPLQDFLVARSQRKGLS